jgi:hypothetical protein
MLQVFLHVANFACYRCLQHTCWREQHALCTFLINASLFAPSKTVTPLAAQQRRQQRMRHACFTDAGSPSPLRGRSRTCRSSAGAACTCSPSPGPCRSSAAKHAPSVPSAPRAHVLPPDGGRRVVRADRLVGRAHGMYPDGVRWVRRHVRAAAVTDSVLTGATHTELYDGELYDGGVRGASLSRHRVYPVSLCRRWAGTAR